MLRNAKKPPTGFPLRQRPLYYGKKVGILENSPKLKYLDICYTPAANAIKDGDWEPDFSQLEAYMTLPD